MKTSPLIPIGSLVFDIGANQGVISRQFLEAGASKVISVEPCHEIFAELYKIPGIIPIHAAAWSCETIIPVFYCARDGGGWSSCVPDEWIKIVPEAKFSHAQFVPTVTLDVLIKTFGVPQLIKVDVEGSEVAVFRALSTKVPFITFEFHRDRKYDALAILTLLKAGLGYSKASFIADNGDWDPQTVPADSIDEAIRKWAEQKPVWGMFTVC